MENEMNRKVQRGTKKKLKNTENRKTTGYKKG